MSNLRSLTLALATILAMGVNTAAAQSTQDMHLLTEQERQAYSQRLQHASTSAERARITAEMNRILQERRLAERAKGGGQGQTK